MDLTNQERINNLIYSVLQRTFIKEEEQHL